jgi:hypothetical protein
VIFENQQPMEMEVCMSQQQELSHFDAAKIIVEALKGLDKPSQTLAMRFASETLGLPSATSIPPTSVVPNANALPQPSQPEKKQTTYSTDIKQFTRAKAPKSDQQFATVVAYYYRFESPETERRDAIDADTVKEAARLAGRKQPKNWTFTLTNARSSGFLDSAGNGKYQINSVGENLVAITLPGDASDVPPNRKPRGKKCVKKKPAAKSEKKRSASKSKAKTDG